MKFVYRPFLVLSWLLLWGSPLLRAQNYLQKQVSLNVQRETLSKVLGTIEQQAGFVFSYNSRLFPTDSLVSVQAQQLPVVSVLHLLFGDRFQYHQSGHHLIIMPARKEEARYLVWISGYVTDQLTGEPVADASVYEPHQLVGTMTDARGYFNMQVKAGSGPVSIHVRKISYADTAVQILPGSMDKLSIGMTQIAYPIDTVVISNVERNWLASRLLSPRQVMNSMNLSGFFTRQPFQFSLVPGLGSHGRMGAQVVNKFSLNVVGGYTAGVNGFELGSLFNIVKQDMRYVQIAGFFNIVGGEANGLQIAGLYNSLRGDMKGLQIGGLFNIDQKDLTGIQIGGLYNQARHVRGLGIAGVGNWTKGNNKGVAIGGLFNRTGTMKGLQIAGLLNRNKAFTGLQVAVVNIADTNKGYSIGLVNISKTGYHKAALSFDETQTLMLSYKSGNPKLYSVLGLGTQLNPEQKAFALGYGLGSDLLLNQRQLFFSPELMHYFFFNGNWSRQNMLERLSFHLKYRVSDKLAVYAGPTLNVFYDKPGVVPEGYKEVLFPGGMVIKGRVKGWVGWTIGVDVF